MGATQVAEGPLIKHVPGGYAEWRAKESGLPPARLRTSEGEWWGKLVGPADTIDVDAGLDTGIGGGDTGDTGDGGGGPISSPDPNYIQPDPTEDQINWDFYNTKVDPYEWKTDYTPIDWDINYNEVPKGYGWGVSTDSPLPYDQGGVGGGPISRGAVVPGGQGDRLTTRGSAGLQKPLVDFKPSPTEYAKDYDPNKTFVEKPGAIKDLKDVATNGLKLGERWIDAIAGKTAADFKPRNPKEGVLFNKFKKGYEIFVAAIKEGGGVFGGTLYETGGGRTTMLDARTGEVPQAHFPNILKTLRKVFAGEKDPIVMQEYGDLHWATIIATIGMANTYGSIVWAIPGLRTMADTIGASMNGMLMDKPNLEGNPIQDTMHRLFWIAGQAGQKVYENSVGKIIEKLRGTPKSDKITRGGTLTEELNDLLNIKDAFKGHKTKRIKVSGDVEAAGEKHLQPRHDPLDLETTDPLSGAGIKKPKTPDPFVPPPVGRKTSPIMVQGPQGQPQGQPRIETFGGASPTQQRDPKIVAKTITGPPEPPQDELEFDPDGMGYDYKTAKKYGLGPDKTGHWPSRVPETGQILKGINHKSIDKTIKGERDVGNEIYKGEDGKYYTRKAVKTEVTPDIPTVELPLGEIPTGKKFDPNDPDRVDPDAVRSKTERKFTKEEQEEFDRQQRQQKQSEQDKQEKERRDKLLEKELTELDPETLKKLKEEGITPVEDPVDPYAETKGEWVRFDNVPIDASGKVWGDVGFDPNNITDYRNEPVRRPEGMSDAEIQADFERIKAEQPKDEPKGDPDPTEPTGLQDFRSDYQKKLGLTVGNQWVNESDSSTWSAIEATQTSQWNQKTQQLDLKYNRNLPQSNIPDHPQYYENNPEHPLNLKPDVNVEWTPAGSKEEIFNWTGQAGLPTYTTIADWQWTGDKYENVNREVMLESESYKKNDGTWEYKYRYVDRRTGEVVEGWKYWNPGG